MTNPMQVTMIEPGDREQARATIGQAVDALARGGLVAFPTETVYGVAASAASDQGVQRLRELKSGGEPRPFTVHLADPAAAERYVDLTSPPLRRLVHKLMPGPVTLVVEVPGDQIDRKLKDLGLPGKRDRLYRGNTISLRCPAHALTQELLAAVDAPVIAGAAQRPGEEPAYDAQEAAEALAGQAELIIDGGRCRYAQPSTVVRLRPGGHQLDLHVEREGVYDERYIRKLMRWTMLLVCSGNTCRSPMAEGIARQLLAEQRGLKPDALDSAGLRVMSAGVAAMDGVPASPEAVEAMRRQGIDLTRHRSRGLTAAMIHEADVIYTMTETHRQAVLAVAPSAAEKTFTLDPTGEVQDPMGSDASTYQRTAEVIRRRLDQRLKEQQP
ncbi:MAG: Sua5/YciO/YrdC/YwlC family protein [Phycisphaeraceae bacterium]